MANLFTVSRRAQSKNPHSRLGKMARIWNAGARSGNFCQLCRVDVGGKNEAQQTEQMNNHLRKAHKAEWEKFQMEKLKAEQAQAAVLDHVANPNG